MKKVLLQDVALKLKKNEYLVIDQRERLAVVYSRNALFVHGEQKVKRIYKIMEDGSVESFNVDKAVNEIVDRVTEKIEVKTLLRQVIRTSYPKDIILAVNLLRSGETISATPRGCYSIMIGKGKKAVEFALSAK